MLRAAPPRRGGRGPGTQVQGRYGNPALTAPPPFGYGAPPNPDIPLVTSEDLRSNFNVKETGVNGERHWHGLGAAGLTVIAAHRDQRYSFFQDLDTTGARLTSLLALQHAQQDSVEARLASESSGSLTWQVGTYYFRGGGFTDAAVKLFRAGGS